MTTDTLDRQVEATNPNAQLVDTIVELTASKHVHTALASKRHWFSPLALQELDAIGLQERYELAVLLNAAQDCRNVLFEEKPRGVVPKPTWELLSSGMRTCTKEALRTAIMAYRERHQTIVAIVQLCQDRSFRKRVNTLHTAGRRIFFDDFLATLPYDELMKLKVELDEQYLLYEQDLAAKTVAEAAKEPVKSAVNWAAQDAKVVIIGSPNPQGSGTVARGVAVAGAGQKKNGKGAKKAKK